MTERDSALEEAARVCESHVVSKQDALRLVTNAINNATDPAEIMNPVGFEYAKAIRALRSGNEKAVPQVPDDREAPGNPQPVTSSPASTAPILIDYNQYLDRIAAPTAASGEGGELAKELRWAAEHAPFVTKNVAELLRMAANALSRPPASPTAGEPDLSYGALVMLTKGNGTSEIFERIQKLRAALTRSAPTAEAVSKPVKWNHGCVILAMNVDLWLPACPQCGMPRPDAIKGAV